MVNFTLLKWNSAFWAVWIHRMKVLSAIVIIKCLNFFSTDTANCCIPTHILSLVCVIYIPELHMGHHVRAVVWGQSGEATAAGTGAPSNTENNLIIENREATFICDPEENRCMYKVTSDPGHCPPVNFKLAKSKLSTFLKLKIKRKPSTSCYKDKSQAPAL